LEFDTKIKNNGKMAKAGDFPGVMEMNADYIKDALELVGNINTWFERDT